MELLFADKLSYPKGFNGIEQDIEDGAQFKEQVPSYFQSPLAYRKGLSIGETFKVVSVIDAPKLSYFNEQISKDFKGYYSKYLSRQRSASIRKERQYQRKIAHLEKQGPPSQNNLITNQNSQSIRTHFQENMPTSQLFSKDPEILSLRKRIDKQKSIKQEEELKKDQLLDDLNYYKVFADKCSRLTFECIDQVSEIYEKKQSIPLQGKRDSVESILSQQSAYHILHSQSTRENTPSNFDNLTPQSVYNPTVEVPVKLRQFFSGEVKPKQFSSNLSIKSTIQNEQTQVAWPQIQNNYVRGSTFSCSSVKSTPCQVKRLDSIHLSQSTAYSFHIDNDDGIGYEQRVFSAQQPLGRFNSFTPRSESLGKRVLTSPDNSFRHSSRLNKQYSTSKRHISSDTNQNTFERHIKSLEGQRTQSNKGKQALEQHDEFFRKSEISHKSIMYATKILKNKFGIIKSEKKI